MQNNSQLPNGRTKLLALLGQHLDNSPSPATHCSWAKACNINIHYNAIAVQTREEFTALTSGLMRSRHFLGANITNPFKADALKLPDVIIDATAQSCGAGNTLFRSPTGNTFVWTVTNTDLQGCSESVEKILSQRSPQATSLAVVLLGAGSMMQTILVAIENSALLRGRNLNISIASRRRTPELERILIRTKTSKQIRISSIDLTQHDWTRAVGSFSGPAEQMLCINTLPSGTSAEAEQVVMNAIQSLDVEFSHAERSLFCVSYGQKPWHRFAETLKWNVLNGDLLFESQARASFKLWTACDAPSFPAAQPLT